jgi:hypothetical protein
VVVVVVWALAMDRPAAAVITAPVVSSVAVTKLRIDFMFLAPSCD